MKIQLDGSSLLSIPKKPQLCSKSIIICWIIYSQNEASIRSFKKPLISFIKIQLYSSSLLREIPGNESPRLKSMKRQVGTYRLHFSWIKRVYVKLTICIFSFYHCRLHQTTVLVPKYYQEDEKNGRRFNRFFLPTL